MNALPQIKEATSVVSRDWNAVLRPFMGRWEPVLDSEGDPLMFESPGLARAAARGHKGGTDLFIRRSALPPSIEEIREVANPPRTPVPPVSIDLSAIDPERSSFDAWRC